MDIRRAGESAVLVELGDLASVLGVAEQLRDLAIRGVRDIVPASRTVLVSAWSPRALGRVIDALHHLEPTGSNHIAAATIDIDVVYDGADLCVVADLLGMSEDAVVAAHTDHQWTAAFGGFAPGFVYLVAADHPLEVPRRTSPRTSVPRGSVAIAGGYSAVYPRASPGGWQLLGRTNAAMWDSSRTPPSLVSPGDTVRFHAVRELVAVRPREADIARVPQGLTVLSPGMQSLIEDLGRPGYAAVGVTRSGAMDRMAATLANELVGNTNDAAVIEAVFGGLSLRAEQPVVLAVTGTDATVRLASGHDEWTVPGGAPFALDSGWTIEIVPPTAGVRSYVAVRGGFAVESELGSRSTDVLSGLGPKPLQAGDALPVGPEPATAVGTRIDVTPPSDRVVLRFVPGPRSDWFTATSLTRLIEQSWEVTADSNRVGLRLEGVRIERAVVGELPSEGMMRGSVQVPPSGQPVLFLADHPVTGGYPVIGTVIDADQDLAGQLAPGNHVTFVPVSPEP